MANYIIHMPNSRPYSLPVSVGFVSELLGETDTFFSHACSLDDSCRKSSPCFSGKFIPQLIKRRHGIDTSLCRLHITGGKDIRVENRNPETADHVGSGEGKKGSENLNDRSKLQSHMAACYSEYWLKNDVIVTVSIRLPGGKGGFGALLKGKGKRKKQSTNIDSCRTLTGERVRHKRLKELSQQQTDANVEAGVTKLPRTTEPPKAESASLDIKSRSSHMKKVRKESKRVKETVARGMRNTAGISSQEQPSGEGEQQKLEQTLKECLDLYDVI